MQRLHSSFSHVPDDRLLVTLRRVRAGLRAMLAEGSRADRAGAELALQAVGIAIHDTQQRLQHQAGGASPVK